MPVTLDQIKKGSRSESLNFGWMEVVSDPYPSGVKQGGWKIDVRFDNTGAIREGVVDRYFIGGYVRDGSIEIPKEVGGRYKTINAGDATIVEYNSTKNLVIEFVNTGNRQTVQLDQLVCGAVRDIKLDEDVRLQQQAFEKMVRAAKEEAERVRKEEKDKIDAENKVKREFVRQKAQAKRDEDAKKAEEYKRKLADAREDKINNLNKLFKIECKILDQERETKGVLNIDFKDREGNWVLRFKRGEEFVQTRLGKMHNNMTQRVRVGKESNDYYKSYSDVEISETFKDAQKFCDWAVRQKGWGLGYNLDKDLLSQGIKIYSEETCCFLPQEINTALVSFKHGVIGTTSKEGFVLQFCLGGLDVLVPGFSAEQDAISAYYIYREKYVKKLAEEYKDAISDRAYDALMNWKLILPD